MSLFKSDLAKEEILGRFLDKQYLKAGLKTHRIGGTNLQYKGVDLLLHDENGLDFKVDEKAQLHYLNKDLPTFALEIDYFKDGAIKPGWLFDSKKITEIYAFVFSIHLVAGVDLLTKEAELASCEVVFVNRLRLINELAMLDLDQKICSAQSAVLRSDAERIKIQHASGFNFQISRQLAEAPVNLVVKRVFLEKIGKPFKFSA